MRPTNPVDFNEAFVEARHDHCEIEEPMEETRKDGTTTVQQSARRHDLDALRAFAMLLGIVLHSAMSFIPNARFITAVQDNRPSPLYGLLMQLIHGWRMPVFFLISGFFTAMLWRKRGLHALLMNRMKRILLPLFLSMFTIIPTIWMVYHFIGGEGDTAFPEPSTVDQEAVQRSDIDVFAAIAVDDQDSLRKWIAEGGDLQKTDPNGSSPLHVACFFGRADAAQILLDAGADTESRNRDQLRPEDILKLDWTITNFIAQTVQVPLDREKLFEQRALIGGMISEKTQRPVTVPDDSVGTDNEVLTVLMKFPLFGHLWFLWFLCWFVLVFAIGVQVCRLLPINAVPGVWLTSVWRYLWLIPLTAVPQYFMARGPGGFGPDTSLGLVPIPAVMLYYLIFFVYGVLYYGADDQRIAVGRGFEWKLPLAILLVFPLAIEKTNPPDESGWIIFSVLQVSYAWLMSFGMIGMFHRFCSTSRFWIRYLSDSSYWLYLIHIPLVMMLQFLVCDWSIPSLPKYLFVCGMTMIILLVSYHYCVRNTWLGGLLNGRRYPPRASWREDVA